MQRITTPDHLFHDGDPFNGIQGTAVTAAWLNSIQEEIACVIEASGANLDPTKSDQLITALGSIFAVAVTQTAGDVSTKVATDEYVQLATGGIASIDVSGGANIALTQAQWGKAIIVLTGALTANINLIAPSIADQWVVINNTSGLFSLTVRTVGGAGVLVSQGRSSQVYCDGVDVKYVQTDAVVPGAGAPVYVNSATTLVAGTYLVDTSVSGFPLTLPTNPKRGTVITLTDAMATWGTNNPVLLRNGKTIMSVAQDLTVNVSDVTFSIWFNGTDWRLV